MLVKYFGPACLAGITLPNWLRLLAANGFRISPQYLGKAAFLSASSVCTSLVQPIESACYGRRIRELKLDPPIFILGCWRSGTTHLHNLLCLDERYSSPSLFQTMYPHTFLTSEPWLLPVLDFLTPKKRFMDNMEQNLREPHEDEMALAIMSLRSNMLSWAFPSNARRYDTFLDFQQAGSADREIWKRCFDEFVRKVTLKTGKQLVLKSPNHTARIQLIRELYPEAKFLHIRRHPYDVYRSMCHMAGKVQPVWGLQTFPPAEIPPMVVATYRRLYDAYLHQAEAVPAGSLHEIAYETLVADPVNTLRDSYERLGLGGFETYEPRLQAYLDSKAGYQKNKHADLPAEERDLLHREWGRFFDRFGYAME